MMKIIRHQLWNQRRQNGWIFVELVVVSFFSLDGNRSYLCIDIQSCH